MLTIIIIIIISNSSSSGGRSKPVCMNLFNQFKTEFILLILK